jgi:hypothetical protein
MQLYRCYPLNAAGKITDIALERKCETAAGAMVWALGVLALEPSFIAVEIWADAVYIGRQDRKPRA